MILGLLLSLFLDRELVFRGEGGRTYRERSFVVAPNPGPAVADGGATMPPPKP